MKKNIELKKMDDDRNFVISLIQGDKGEIKSTSDFRQLVKLMLGNKKLVNKGKEIAEYANSDLQKYNLEKAKSPGFVIGDFSYRDSNSCIKYEPVIGFDIDHIENENQYKSIWDKITKWPFTFVAFPSISQKGIRVLVYTQSNKETHKDYYNSISISLSSLIGFPRKTKIKENLRGLGYDKIKIKKFLDTAVHIDDVTNDISRFWYYSGLSSSQFYSNKNSEIFVINKSDEFRETKKVINSKSLPSDYLYTFTDEDKISYLTTEIEKRAIDITSGVVEWFKVGLSLYDALGDYAESYFDRISRFHPDYNSSACKREWDRVRSKYSIGGVSIATFYKWCADAGVNLDFKELKEIHSHKFIKNESSLRKNKIESTVKETPDLDAVVIATCIKKSIFIASITDVAPKFNSDCFSTNDAQIVFSVIESLIIDNMTVNPVSVRAKLKYAGHDEKILNQFSAISPSLNDFLTNIRLLYSQYTKRQFIEVAQSAISEVSEPDIEAVSYVLDFADKIDKLTDLEADETELNGSELAMSIGLDYKRIIEARKNSKDAITGIPTGLKDYDALLGGFQDTDLLILAARPGQGKTALALKHASTAAIDNKLPVAFYSLEMSSLQLGKRIACIRAEVTSDKVKKGELSDLEFDRYTNALQDIEKSPLFIDDKPGATYSYIRNKARKIKRKHGLSMVIVDYLQLMEVPKYMKSKNENSTVGYNSRKLKELAKELGVPVICLSQLSRAVETRGGDKRPQLSDLRDSGSIEQDADIVSFIYRPEYYKIMEDSEGNSLKGVAEIIVAKNRHGALEDIVCAFEGQYTKFWDGVSYSYESKKAKKVDEFLPKKTNTYNPSISNSSKPNDDDSIPF